MLRQQTEEAKMMQQRTDTLRQETQRVHGPGAKCVDEGLGVL